MPFKKLLKTWHFGFFQDNFWQFVWKNVKFLALFWHSNGNFPEVSALYRYTKETHFIIEHGIVRKENTVSNVKYRWDQQADSSIDQSLTPSLPHSNLISSSSLTHVHQPRYLYHCLNIHDIFPLHTLYTFIHWWNVVVHDDKWLFKYIISHLLSVIDAPCLTLFRHFYRGLLKVIMN